jgi:hypothetical protein
MVTAIQFNDEFFARRTEVYDVVANGMLIAEMNISHVMRSQVSPEFGFWFGHFAVELFRAPEDFWGGAFMNSDFDPLCPLDISPNWRAQLGEKKSHDGKKFYFS